jgi:hypothetical protein
LIPLTALGASPQGAYNLAHPDRDFLNNLQFRSFRYFWERAGRTGIVYDRAPADGSPPTGASAHVGSIAATGFGLTAICIAAERKWIAKDAARDRILLTLRYLYYQAPTAHGWFYHYVDPETGERVWASEASSIDTALLLAGVLTASEYFLDDDEITVLARAIYSRVDFPWMLNGDAHLLCHGWTPESGFLPYRWDSYSELMILYVLAIGSPTHPIAPESWFSWKRPEMEFDGIRFITGGPLFTHQYAHAYFDFRLLREKIDKPVDWFANSIAATRAQREFCYKLALVFPSYGADMWGITASDGAMGYTVWGEPPYTARIDGTIVPSAAGGSLMFVPEITVPALRKMHDQFGSTVYRRYGFVDAFNPSDSWVAPDVVGIDAGIILLSAENLRSGFVWQHFMKTDAAVSAVKRIGFQEEAAPKPNIFRRLFRWLAG